MTRQYGIFVIESH